MYLMQMQSVAMETQHKSSITSQVLVKYKQIQRQFLHWLITHGKRELKPKLTIEVDGANVLEEHPSFNRVHLITDTHGPRTQVQVHAVQGMCHGIHSINHKLHLPLLFILWVATDSFFTWKKTKGTHKVITRCSQYFIFKISPVCYTVSYLYIFFFLIRISHQGELICT